ncbi:hypothetical protein FA10DRAFT_261741 [Acaromyces ingoldii]|uniref:3'-5' exonuclease n=1 Tax=Acaromyces ingoldii TaxID=215250 RepID=A0A316YFM0_9BASI|nr:hypothetical protein FA10DRAFT_261741 [Acaromyces ingoldii]PWN88350.1 hypothetical protein FA10DRAFT_261741 [Acaromyces ingoldii]
MLCRSRPWTLCRAVASIPGKTLVPIPFASSSSMAHYASGPFASVSCADIETPKPGLPPAFDWHKSGGTLAFDDDLDELLLSVPEEALDSQSYLTRPSSRSSSVEEIGAELKKPGRRAGIADQSGDAAAAAAAAAAKGRPSAAYARSEDATLASKTGQKARNFDVVEISDDEKENLVARSPSPAFLSSQLADIHVPARLAPAHRRASSSTARGEPSSKGSSSGARGKSTFIPGIAWLERRWNVGDLIRFGDERKHNMQVHRGTKKPKLSQSYSTQPTVEMNKSLAEQTIERLTSPSKKDKTRSLRESGAVEIETAVTTPTVTASTKMTATGLTYAGRSSTFREKRAAALRRERERQQLEKDYATYSYKRPAGFIESMKKDEEQLERERQEANPTAEPTKARVAVPTHASPVLILASTAEAIDEALEPIPNGTPLSFDMEWPAVFKAGQMSKTGLIQIAAPSRIVVCQVDHLEKLPKHLVRLIEDGETIKCGVAISGDFSKLRSDFGQDVTPRNVVELSTLAKLAEPDRWAGHATHIALRDLTRIYLRRKLDKDSNVRMSNWAIKVLSEQQLDYAASDVYVGLEILFSLAKHIDQLNRTTDSPPSTFTSEDVSKALRRSRTDARPRVVDKRPSASRTQEAEAAIEKEKVEPDDVAAASKADERAEKTATSSGKAKATTKNMLTPTSPDSKSDEKKSTELLTSKAAATKKTPSYKGAVKSKETKSAVTSVEATKSAAKTRKETSDLPAEETLASEGKVDSEEKKTAEEHSETCKEWKFSRRHREALQHFRAGLDFAAVGAKMRTPPLRRPTIATYIVHTLQFGGERLDEDEVKRFSEEMNVGLGVIRYKYSNLLKKQGVDFGETSTLVPTQHQTHSKLAES